MLFILLIGLVAGTAIDMDAEIDMRDPDSKFDAATRWSKFKVEMEKNYSEQEEIERFEIFKVNLQRIKEHNQLNKPYFFKVTQFADMTPEEFKEYTKCGDEQMLSMKKLHEATQSQQQATFRRLEESETELADSIDWVAEGKVNAVKNQGQCGSCWSFSANCAMESRAAVAGYPLVSLSEQELVDCSTGYGNHGCNGGSMALAFEFAQQSGGLCSESSYPYKAQDDVAECSSMTSNCGTKLDPPNSTGSVQANSEFGLEYALKNGPVSVAIEADQRTFQLYGGGVFDGSCGTRLDHGVVVVGYGTDSSTYEPFWKVRNSWGPTWGEAGYIRLCRECSKNNGAGQCGVLMQPVYPVY